MENINRGKYRHYVTSVRKQEKYCQIEDLPNANACNKINCVKGTQESGSGA